MHAAWTASILEGLLYMYIHALLCLYIARVSVDISRARVSIFTNRRRVQIQYNHESEISHIVRRV